jgi:hypothetical protein
MPDRSKGRGQTKCSPWSSRLGVGRGTNNATPEKCTVTKPPEPMEDHGGGQEPHRVVAPVEKKFIQNLAEAFWWTYPPACWKNYRYEFHLLHIPLLLFLFLYIIIIIIYF